LKTIARERKLTTGIKVKSQEAIKPNISNKTNNILGVDTTVNTNSMKFGKGVHTSKASSIPSSVMESG